MASLRDEIQQVVELARRQGLPAYNDMVVVFTGPKGRLTNDGKMVVDAGEIQPVAAAEPKWNELLGAGHPWINVTCGGVYRGDLLIVVETGRTDNLKPGIRTSVNHSGAMQGVVDAGWDAEAMTVVTK